VIHGRLGLLGFPTQAVPVAPAFAEYGVIQSAQEDAMTPPDNFVSGLAKTEEDVLTFDVPDDALERVVGIPDGRAFTLVYCTHDWKACPS
jgi:hypothetical protein